MSRAELVVVELKSILRMATNSDHNVVVFLSSMDFLYSLHKYYVITKDK